MAIITADKLSNPEYQALPQIGGSSLVKIHNDCPAAWRFGDNEPTKALADGIAAHAAILEPEMFAAQFVRGIDPADYPDALDTNKSMEAWLKERGIKGYGGKDKAGLMAMIAQTGEHVEILAAMIDEHAITNQQKTIVDPKTYDMIVQMRAVIFSDDTYRAAFTGSGGKFDAPMFELSSINHPTKCRWDCITADGEIWDYKTTITAHPEKFARSAHENGYWLKMALQHDHYELEFGERPRRVVLLAQSKKAPYIPQAYELTDEQLQVGREQYQAALRLYGRCLAADVWPAYGGGIVQLPTPNYLAYKYEFENND
jgi:hypothetical protein